MMHSGNQTKQALGDLIIASWTSISSGDTGGRGMGVAELGGRDLYLTLNVID